MSLKINIDTNMYDYSVWEAGQTGVIGDFGIYSAAENNTRDISVDPFGNQNVLWRGLCNVSTGSYNEGIYCTAKTIDPTKLYRMSIWERRVTNGTATAGRYYFGLNGFGTVNGVTNHTTPGAANTNPYFYNTATAPTVGDLNLGNWVLLVGHIWPYDQSVGTTHANSGVWKPDGTKLANITQDFSFLPQSTSVRLRTLAIYQANNGGVEHHSIYPRMDLVDGAEPSLETLLNGEGPWRNVNGIYVNIGDTWKNVNEGYINIGDTWKNFYSGYVDASGGIMTTIGDYKIHTFDSSGNFIVYNGGDVSIMLIGGGAGGGSGAASNSSPGYGGAGGGAGEMIQTSITVSASTYLVNIGKGGDGGAARTFPNNGVPGSGGGITYFSTLDASTGGGGGGGNIPTCTGGKSGSGYAGATANGGGGGGNSAAASAKNGGTGTVSQLDGSTYAGGGGGWGGTSASTKAGSGGQGGSPGYYTTSGAGGAGVKGKVVIKYKFQ